MGVLAPDTLFEAHAMLKGALGQGDPDLGHDLVGVPAPGPFIGAGQEVHKGYRAAAKLPSGVEARQDQRDLRGDHHRGDIPCPESRDQRAPIADL